MHSYTRCLYIKIVLKEVPKGSCVEIPVLTRLVEH